MGFAFDVPSGYLAERRTAGNGEAIVGWYTVTDTVSLMRLSYLDVQAAGPMAWRSRMRIARFTDSDESVLS